MKPQKTLPATLCALASLTLAACAEGPGLQGPAAVVTPPSDSGAVFKPEAFAWSQASGSASLQGAVTFHAGPTRYACQGGDVLLTPETGWSRRRMIILYGSATAASVPASIVRARIPSAPTGDYARFVRRTTCDADSHFTFSNLPDGAWYVITVAKSTDGQGEPMALTRRVETHGGSKTVTLN